MNWKSFRVRETRQMMEKLKISLKPESLLSQEKGKGVEFFFQTKTA
jgi:hypothetical protein